MGIRLRRHGQIDGDAGELTSQVTHHMDAKDSYTRGHSERVGVYASKIARQMEHPKALIERVYIRRSSISLGLNTGILLRSTTVLLLLIQSLHTRTMIAAVQNA